MNIGHLVEMVNDIAEYFAFDPEHDEAVDDVLAHLRKYWEPRMRREIVAYVRAGGKGLKPLAQEAVVKMGESDRQIAA